MASDLLQSLETAAARRQAITQDPTPGDGVDAVKARIAEEGKPLSSVPLVRWPRLSSATKFLHRRALSALGGSPGGGKSLLSLHLGLACTAAGAPWAYLPLESDRAFHLRRLAAILDRSFDPIEDTEDRPDMVARATAAVERVRNELSALAPSVCENPRLPGPTGEPRGVDGEWILRWIDAKFSLGVRTVIIDSLAFIQFGGRDEWRAQNDFVEKLSAMAWASEQTIVLVVHTTKKTEGRTLELGDLQGGASLGRAADAVVIVEDHAPKNVEVFRAGGCTAQVEANRVLHIAKARSGSGKRLALAFRFGEQGPSFSELGIIAPRSTRNGPTAPARMPYRDADDEL